MEPRSAAQAIPTLAQIPASPGNGAVETIAQFIRARRVPLAIGAAAFVALFWPGFTSLWTAWSKDPDFSQGFLIPVISVAILWANRERLAGLPARRSSAGLALLLASILLFLVGHLTLWEGATRYGLLGALLGSVWFLLGTPLFRTKPFPFLFLVFAIPPPAALFAPLKLGLQGIATRLSGDLLRGIGFPAISEANVLVVGDERFGVEDACSGIRSLMAIVATAVLFGYLFRTGLLKGVLLTATAIPVTIANNLLRIVIMTVAKVEYDIDLTANNPTPHNVLSLIIFSLTLVCLYLIWRFYDWLLRWKPEEKSP